MDLSENIRMNITHDSLPTNFENEIVENTDIVTIRSNVNSTTHINEWVKEFSNLTNTKWNSRNSCPAGERFVCKKKFVCHYSSFNKVPSEKKTRGISKNVECLASIAVKIKLNTSSTRKKDDFIRRGLVGIITITPFHKHSFMKTETLRSFPDIYPVEHCRIKLEENSNDALEPIESTEYPNGLLKIPNFQSRDMIESRINPTLKVTEISSLAERNNNKELCEKLIKLFRDGVSKYNVSEQAVKKAISHLEKISSKEQWEAMLETLGSNVPL